MVNKKEVLRELLKDENAEFSDSELINRLLENNVSRNLNDKEKESLSFGQRAADSVARFAGSWAFIFCFVGVMIVWMIVNVLLALNAFDAYPFILLNLLLSCLAAVQAPLIMMSQNRQEQKDRARAENDYKVNLKNELLIGEIFKRTEHIITVQNRILHELEKAETEGGGESGASGRKEDPNK